MPDRLLTVAEASAALSLPDYTLRRWCDWHAAHLSAYAVPASGVTRRFTPTDIAVLGEVKRLRDEGLHTAQINDQLARVVVVEAAEALQGDTEAPQATQTALVVLGDITTRLAALESSAQETQQQQAATVRGEVARLERRAALYFAAGVAVALVVVAIVVLLLRP